MKWNLSQIQNWTGGQILSSFKIEFSEIGTDTRLDLTGKIFIALKGDQFDAHQFLEKAVMQGAALLIVHELPAHFENLKERVSILKVNDTLKALQDFAHYYRKSLSCKIIGITGSNGKTTTKEFTAQILSQFGKTHYSEGSFNNHWGVPFTLLHMAPDTQFAVVEMGMNHFGEISKLVEIAVPNVAVCTMVGLAHIEFFGSQAQIAKAKSEIYLDANEDCIRIFNQDQDLTFDMMYPVARKFPESRMLSFSEINPDADVFFKVESAQPKNMKIIGKIGGEAGSAIVSIFGRHNIVNLMAAASLAYAVGMKPERIWKALELCKTSWGRNQFIETESGAEILFDGYNANPDSMNALIENVREIVAERKIAVLGQMKELGEAAREAHIALGLKAGQAGFSQIYFIGKDFENFNQGLEQSGFSGERYIKSEYSNELASQLGKSIKKGDFIAIKGSRWGIETERFVDHCAPINWSIHGKSHT